MAGFFKDNPPATQVGSEDATESTIQEDAVTQTDTSGGFYQGSPDQTTTDAYTADALASKNAAEAAKVAAEAAQAASESAKTAAETAETNAETAETNAETAETNAETAETNAAASQSAAATSATNAAGSATTATTKASEAATSATNAATSATSAETAKTAAETAETNAETAETNAASSASSASTSASNASTSATAASGSASAASTSETNAASSATAAATSATNAASSATNAASSATSASGSATTATTQASTSTTQASNSATSATAASNSASSAASAQTAAEAARDSALAALDSFDDRYLGTKSSAPSLDNDGNALVSGALYFDTTSNAMNVYDGSQWLSAYVSLSGALIANQNLSDLNNVPTARTNLGLGSAATTDSTAYATAAQADQTVTLTGGTGISTSGTYPNFTVTNSSPDQTVALTGAGATTISGTYPNFTITSTDTNTNTEYTAGSGITLTGTTFSNAAPDQTVSLTGAGATTISGTYPNFTITSTDTNTDTNTEYSAGTNISLSGTTFNLSTNLSALGTISSGAITVNQNGDALNLRSTSNAQPVRVTFSSDVPDAQIGHIEYTHSDSASYGSGEALILSGTENQRTILADGKLMTRDGLYIKPASGTGAGTLIINSSGHLRNLGGELRADSTFKMLTEAGSGQLLQTQGVAAGTSYSTTLAYQGEFNALTGYRVGNTAVIDSSRNLVNINSVEIGNKVTLAESTDRADLLQITGTTAGWAGLQIRNSSGEGRWSFMTDGAIAGIYDDENNDWYMQFNELGATEIFHNSAQKLTTTTGGISVTGLVGATTVTASGLITADRFLSGLGTAASPAFQVGDTNTGFFDSGANTIGVACNGAHEFNFTAATLDMNGNTMTDCGGIAMNANTNIAIGSSGGDAFNADSAIRIGDTSNAYLQIITGTSAQSGILLGDTADDFVGGLIYLNSSNRLDLYANNATQLQLGNGSAVFTASAIDIPSQIRHSGDTNTYMQFHAADQWRVVAGGTERLEVNGATVTVASTLNVRAAIDLADNDILRLGSGDDAELFCNGSHLYLDLNSGIGNFYIRDGTTTRYTFNDNGSFTATGNITAYSDRRVKAQFEPITDALAKVQQLHGQTYIRTDMDDANRRYAGLIAQDVEAVLPEAVTEIEDHLTLDYSGTIGLLVEAIKELKQEVNDLKAQLEDK